MLAQMSWSQFRAWVAYDHVDPIGEFRGDLRSGIIASIIANVNRGKSSKVYSATDFMPKFGQERPTTGNREPVDASAWAAIKSVAKAMASAEVADGVKKPRRRRGSA